MKLDDVDLNGVDDEHVAGLVDSTTFSRPQVEAIVRFAKVDEDDRDPDLIRNYVYSTGDESGSADGLTVDECDRIRTNMGKASRPKTVIDAWPNKHPSAIFRHATGRCDHDGDVDPVTSPRIEVDECRDMRADFQTGDTVEDIRHAFNRSANAVVKHVFGRCNHDEDRPAYDRSGRAVSGSACPRMRRAYRENGTAAVAGIASAFTVGTSTAHRHLSGACKHGDDVEAPIAGNGTATISKPECDRMRAVYSRGVSVDDAADRFDRDVTSIRRHAFGRCRHGSSTYEPDRQTVDAERCDTIRRLYRTRGDTSVDDLIDRLNVSKGTFYYHLRGECDHDTDEQAVDPTASGLS